MNPPLMFRIDPRTLKTREAAQFAKRAGLEGTSWKGFAWETPYFKTPAEIVELTEEGRLNPPRHYILVTEDSAAPVEFRHGYVEELAARLGLNLKRDNVDDYLRFYLGFARGQAGRVLPVEQVEQLPLREELTLITRRKLQNAITPLVVQDVKQLTGCFLIHDKLYMARADIAAGGAVVLEPISLLADTLPVSEASLES